MLKELFNDYFGAIKENSNSEFEAIQNKANDNLSLIGISSSLYFFAMLSCSNQKSNARDY